MNSGIIIQNGDMGVTTNPLENINLKLKSKMGHGYLTQKSVFRKLKHFEEEEISLSLKLTKP